MGRFISADPYLDGLNRYTYVHNNPIRYTDPTGYKYDPDEDEHVIITGTMNGNEGGGGPTGGGNPPGAPNPVITGVALTLVFIPEGFSSAARIGLLLLFGGAAVCDYYFNPSYSYPEDTWNINLSEDASKQRNRNSGGKRSLEDMQKNPPNHPAYKPPKNWNGKKVKNPNGPGSGWPDEKGRVWVPTDHKGTHAPHCDVQLPKGRHIDIYP